MQHPYFNLNCDDLQSSHNDSIANDKEIGARHRLTLLINPEIKIEESNNKGNRRLTDKPPLPRNRELIISVASLNKESNSISINRISLAEKDSIF